MSKDITGHAVVAAVDGSASGGRAGRVRPLPGRGDPRPYPGRGATGGWAQSADAQLLVVGSRGHGGLTGMMLGSTSQALIYHATCPLVVARPTH